jgi:hypothetical protein
MTITRRQFIGTTAMGTLALGPTVRDSLAAGFADGPGFPTSRIRVERVYLAKPVPSWPNPKLDVQEEMGRLEATLAALQKKEMPEVELCSQPLLVRRPEDLGNLKAKLSEADAVLAFNLTSGVGNLFQPVARSGLPTILFSQPYSGHDWSGVAALQKEGLKIECLATSDYHEIVDVLRPIRAIHRMKESRLVYLNTRAPSQPYAEKLKATWGTAIAHCGPERFNAIFAKADVTAAQAVVNRWKTGARKVVEPSDKDLLDSARFYLAMRQVMTEEQAQGITINCLGLFGVKVLPAYPCLGFTELNNKLFVGGCEGDLDSAATMLLFGYMVRKPGFISDPVIDTAKNVVIHAHCVAPTLMDGPGGKRAPYIIRSHLEDDKGAVLQVTMRTGQPVTMAKLICDSDQMLLSTAKITGTPAVERGCRTKITTAVPDARKILEGYAYGLHRVIFYGDHTLDVKRLGRFRPPLRVVVEG